MTNNQNSKKDDVSTFVKASDSKIFYGGVLSDLQILAGIENGCIVVEPFNEHQLNPNSYDVTIKGVRSFNLGTKRSSNLRTIS